MEDNLSGLPLWAWIVIGCAALLVVIGVIVVTVVLMKRSGRSDFF